jgi:DNA-binding transcriptional LysR family regulator
MHLTLRQLEIFAAVADHGTTTAAGRQIALSQSAISGALAELEHLLGSALFDRIGKRLVLNDNGRALLPQARALLDGARDVETQFGVDRGRRSAVRPIDLPIRLRLAASTTIGNYLLPDLIAGFCADAISPRIDVRIGNTREVATAVARLDVDLGLIEGPCHEPDVEARPWITDELVVVCAALHPLAVHDRQHRVTLAQLRDASWLLREPGSGTREAVEHALLPQLHQLRGGIDFGGTESIKQAAAAGLGLTCLSHYVVRDLVALGRLVVLRTPLRGLRRRFYLIHHREKRFSAGMERFVSHCFRVQR